MRIEYDPEVHAVYVYLRDIPYAFGKNLDLSRRIDYAADAKPMGVELLNVHRGVNLEDLPEQEAIGTFLKENGIRAFASSTVG